MSTPIVTSLMEADFYKFTMGQLVFEKFPEARVRYAFTNRTKDVRLADVVPEGRLREELDHVRSLRFAPEDVDYLRTCPQLRPGTFSERYLASLSTLALPEYELEVVDGQFRIEVEREWPDAILWETLGLNIAVELYVRQRMTDDGIRTDPDRDDAFWKAGWDRLRDKVERFKKLDGAQLMEFGNRRHASGSWHGAVLNYLMDELPTQLVGTSNVHLARTYGLRPCGTFAHELFMVYAGLLGETDEGLRGSHNRVLRDWRERYGDDLSVALTDTFGSDFFFRDFMPEQAREWKGLRHDSGDPFAFGERAIAFYEAHGVDPKDKLLVYSDGLDIDRIERLHARFAGRIGLLYGWGTNLTNDLGYRTLSLVMKPVSVDGRPVVKLSDNPAKASGPKEVVDRHVRVFSYVPGTAEECTY